MTVTATDGQSSAVPPLAEQVAVLARFGRDASVVGEVLRQADVSTRVERDLTDLTASVRAGVGAVLLTAESLATDEVGELAVALAEQPAWSSVPLLVLLGPEGEQESKAARALAALRSVNNVLVLQRPIPAITLVTAVQSALYARHRQYDVRDLLARERQAREEAEAATRIKDEFLASVSHELRTPLSAILIWAHLLDEGRLTPEQIKHATKAITSGADSQSQLIEDLLDVSRMLTGKIRLDAKEQKLAPILVSAIDVVRPMAEAKGLGMDVKINSDADPVRVDAERIQQIFWNLLSNAVKFTSAPGSLSVELVRELGHVRVQVSDTGEGIETGFLPHVFERFRQGDASLTRRQGGLGLGLTIVHQLVELHGGTVDVKSAGKERGATFTVRLPLSVGPHASNRARAGRPAHAAMEASLLGVRVLLVENEPEMRLALCWLLRQAGAEVTALSDGITAMEALTSSPPGSYPHVLVSDIAMPEQDGNGLIRELRAREARSGMRALPAIAISAYSREEDRQAAFQAGFQLHLPKPVVPIALQQAVHTLLTAPAPQVP